MVKKWQTLKKEIKQKKLEIEIKRGREKEKEMEKCRKGGGREEKVGSETMEKGVILRFNFYYHKIGIRIKQIKKTTKQKYGKDETGRRRGRKGGEGGGKKSLD